MDLLTRKKLLMRKYNNPTFTLEELDFFSKVNATEIIALLKENPLLRTSAKFFEHTHIHEMEKILASIFEPEQNFARSQIFNILVNLLRESTTVLQACFKKEDFNYMSIFGFLQEQHIDYAILILLEDVLLPFIRKTPFQLIKIIVNDEYIEQLFLRRIYEKPIFKIIYTVVFCLSKRHSEQCKNEMRKIIRELVNTPFTYLLHRDKKIHENITIIAQDKTELKSPTKKQDNKQSKYKYFDSDSKELFPPVHTKKVRQKRRTSCGVSCQEVQQFQLKGKKQSNGSTMKKSQQSTSSVQMMDIALSQQLLQHEITLHRSIPLHSNPHVHSLAQLDQSNKHIVFNEDLCYGDLTQNMKQLLTDIGLNIKYVYIKNVLMLLENFNEEYVESLVANVRRYAGEEEYERYCYGAVDILYEFGQLYKSVLNYQKTIPRSSCVSDRHFEKTPLSSIGTLSPSKISTNANQYQSQLSSLITKLQKQIRIIASKIPILSFSLLEDNQQQLRFSSGEQVKKVTMAKYKIIQLICQLLSFNNSNNSENEWYLDLSANIKFRDINVYAVLNKYFKMTKWNSILHASLTKLIKLLLQQDYQGFKQQCIVDVSPKDSLLGTLFELYRNKKYIHLANMKFTNYGNLHMIYDITTIIVESLLLNHDYDLLISKFRDFDYFVHSDILGYQGRIDAMSQWFDQKIMPRESQIIQNTVPCEDMNGKIISASLQNAQELMNQLENSKRWISFSQTRKSTL